MCRRLVRNLRACSRTHVVGYPFVLFDSDRVVFVTPLRVRPAVHSGTVVAERSEDTVFDPTKIVDHKSCIPLSCPRPSLPLKGSSLAGERSQAHLFIHESKPTFSIKVKHKTNPISQ